MSVYAPLTAFLLSQGGREVRMSFAEIERVLGRKLPEKSKAVRAWWSNNASNNVMTKAWLAAGFRTARVDVGGETLSFVPDAPSGGFAEMKQKPFDLKPGKPTQKPAHHPAYGALKGMVTLLPDVDYTEPADPDWAKVYDE